MQSVQFSPDQKNWTEPVFEEIVIQVIFSLFKYGYNKKSKYCM